MLLALVIIGQDTFFPGRFIEKTSQGDFPVGTLFQLLARHDGTCQPGCPVQIVNILCKAVQTHGCDGGKGIKFGFVLFRPLRIQQVDGELEVLNGTVPAPPCKHWVFLFKMRGGECATGSGFQIVRRRISCFCLHVVFVTTDILCPNADNQSTQSVAVTEAGTQNPVHSPACLFQQAFVEDTVFALYGTGHIEEGDARFGCISRSLSQVGCIVPSSGNAHAPSVGMIGEYILMAFLMNAGLVETATFGKEEVQRVPGGRQVGIISDGERL